MSTSSEETNPLMLPSKNMHQFNIESIRLSTMSMIASIHSRVSLDTLRPLPMFLGLHAATGCLSIGSFTPPVKKVDKNAPEKVKSRVQLNFAFFLTNYVLVAAMVALVVTLMHPSTIFVMAIVWAIWKLHAFLIRNEVDLFGVHVHNLLTIQQRFYINLVVTFILMVWKCLVPTLTIVSIAGLLVVTHAVLRDPKQIESSSVQLLNESYDEEDVESGKPGQSDGLIEGRGETD